MVLTKTTYIANDGQEFGTEQEAIDHETAQHQKMVRQYDKYMKTANGKELLRKYDTLDEGIWIVRSEEYQTIGRYEGVLMKVVERAVMNNTFWGWGGGGTIYKEEPAIKV